MDLELALLLAEEIEHTAEDGDRADSGHSQQWLTGYIAGMASALELVLGKPECHEE